MIDAVALTGLSDTLANIPARMAVLERVVAANVRTGRLCADCGAEATIALVTSLGRRICSTCARADAAVARRACLPRRLSA